MTQDMEVWINCIDVQDSENLAFHAGDSEGSMLDFKASDDWRQNCEFRLDGDKKRGIHKQNHGIIQILDLMKKESCIFTIGYDQYINGYGKSKEMFFNYANPNKCLFTSIAWDDKDKLLYIADEQGYVYIAHVYLGEKETIQKKVCNGKINQIQVYNTQAFGSILFVFTERIMQAYRIKIGQKTQDIEGHTDSILKIIALEPSRLEQKTNEKIPDDPKIITCSLDNTIRLWDSIKIEVMNVLQAPEHSEISCMTFLVKSCLVATGHEDGSIRLWNLDISSSVLLKSPKYQHTNSISCIIGVIEAGDEYLVAGSYDGTISVWDVNPPVGKDSSGNAVS